MKRINYKSLLLILLAVFITSACDGGNSGNSSSGENEPELEEFQLNVALPENGATITTTNLIEDSAIYPFDNDTSSEFAWVAEETGNQLLVEFEVPTEIHSITKVAMPNFLGKSGIFTIELSEDGNEWYLTFEGTTTVEGEIGCDSIYAKFGENGFLTCTLDWSSYKLRFRFMRLTVTSDTPEEVEIYEIQVDGIQLK